MTRRLAELLLAGLALLLAGVGLVAGSLAAATPAWAHDVLVSTDPAAGAVLTSAPANVRFSFTDPVLDGSAQVRVTGPSGVASTGAVLVSGATVTAPLSAARGYGTYTVLWRVTSQDGHPVSGSFAFTVAASGSSPPPATPPPPAGTVPPPAGTVPTPAAATPATGRVSATSSALVWAWLLLVAAGAGLFARRWRSR